MITRWNPFREMAAMQRVMDRFFEDWRPFPEEQTAMTTRGLALDVHEDDASYVITTDMPGVQTDNVQIRCEGDYLLIEGEVRQEKTTEQEGKRPLVQERHYGRFSRRLRLPQNINLEQADARLENGVLTLTLPKVEAPQPKMIPVKSGKS